MILVRDLTGSRLIELGYGPREPGLAGPVPTPLVGVDAANDEAVLKGSVGCNIGCGGGIAPTTAADSSKEMMPPSSARAVL